MKVGEWGAAKKMKIVEEIKNKRGKEKNCVEKEEGSRRVRQRKKKKINL